MVKHDPEKFATLFEDFRKKYRVDFSGYASASLNRRIERFLSIHHFVSESEFVEKLLSDHLFFDLFIKEITVNTTEMFRDPECWMAVREKVLPLVTGYPGIRIWHAGCSSGEEVYSMAILLKEEGLYDKVSIVATDLNRDVIQTAMSGTYGRKSLELNEENYRRAGGRFALSDYYSSNGTSYTMNSELLSRVKFMKFDLSSGMPFSKFDIIFCRNVLIYFNKGLQENVFKLFRESLFKRGSVVIGKKESMAYYSDFSAFNEINLQEKIYQLK